MHAVGWLRGVVLCVSVVVLVSDDRLNPWNGGRLFAEARLCDFTSSSLTQVPLGQTEHAVCHTLYVELLCATLVLGGGAAEPLTLLLLLLLLLTYICGSDFGKNPLRALPESAFSHFKGVEVLYVNALSACSCWAHC